MTDNAMGIYNTQHKSAQSERKAKNRVKGTKKGGRGGSVELSSRVSFYRYRIADIYLVLHCRNTKHQNNNYNNCMKLKRETLNTTAQSNFKVFHPMH